MMQETLPLDPASLGAPVYCRACGYTVTRREMENLPVVQLNMRRDEMPESEELCPRCELQAEDVWQEGVLCSECLSWPCECTFDLCAEKFDMTVGEKLALSMKILFRVAHRYARMRRPRST